MELKEIQELINVLDKSSIDELDYKFNDMKLSLKKIKNKIEEGNITQNKAKYVEESHPQKIDSIQEESKFVDKKKEEVNLHEITSPMVGTFYNASSPTEDPYVEVGAVVKKNTIVCMVEAMKLFNEIEAEIEGEIKDVLVKNGELVEYGQPLFLVKKN
ncbi:acetyl-CoA carboxylase biotin carboxyl carrier protein [Priestia megaterium]|uniref:acetyl-CoA carboxylase biotin carboxyl carrier protein n=1 Tax=Priestia megaterium TaxID=1404 RepID=UPI0030C96867